MLLDLFIAISCGGAGLACGWVMHATGLTPAPPAADRTLAQASEPEAAAVEMVSEIEANREQISEVAERLRSYARTMAADVDAHQTTVAAVNHRLTSDQGGSQDAVFAAINQLIEANELMQSQLHLAQDRIQDQAMQIESAERRADSDALTRVPNRGAFDKHFHQQHALGVGRAGTLAILDVDHFKKFNDVYGHRAGDEVLKVVAGILHSQLNKHGIVARFGGEEFAIILDGCPIGQAKHLVDTVRAAIGQREIVFEDKRLRVTASAGVAELMADEQAESWLQRADDGLYRSKEAGRDCGHWMDGTDAIKIETSADTSIVKEKQSDRATDGGNDAEHDTDLASSKPKTFANLPNRADLSKTFDLVRGRTQSAVSTYVMAIRCNTTAGNSAMRSLMQIIRATLRSVDRLGCEDDSTFLVFLPSVDEATAQNRSTQICRSASAIGLGKSDSPGNPITIGVSQVRIDEDFDCVVGRCIQLAELANVKGSDAVRMESAESVA